MQIEVPVVYQFECFRKGKNGNKKYIGILRQDRLDLCKVQYLEDIDILGQPTKFQIFFADLALNTYKVGSRRGLLRREKALQNSLIQISISAQIHSNISQVKQINENHVAKITTFCGDEKTLTTLKEHLRNKIIFQRIQDFYTPLQTLGKGASSRVLLVRHKNTENYYAAKCVDKSYVNETENGIESMFQEIAINNDLEHPSFIKLHAVYEGDNTFYMVMDLLEGKSLHEELNNHKNGFSEDIVRNIMWQILTGIEYMHEKQIMHRDLKPENIMLLRKEDLNSLKIVDFGLATYCNANKYLFPKCGTPGYVAPEIANLTDKAFKYDKVCDIFSAGVIFFKLLTGKDLFPGVGFNLVLKLNKQCKIDLTPLQMKKIDPFVTTLIQKMLEKEPTQRITATQCLQDPFFLPCYQEIGIQGPAKLTAFQKKHMFSTCGKAFTTEFQNENQKGSPSDRIENKGSFVTQETTYKPIQQHQQKIIQKFNTTEFDHIDPSQSPSMDQVKKKFQKGEPIEEEDEK